MRGVLLAEWIKLRSVTVHVVLVVVAVAFPLVVITLVAALSDDFGFIGSRELASLVTGISVLSAMLIGTVAAISLTSEFTHGTIRPTFAATPRRTAVMLVKLGLDTVVAAVLAGLIVTVGWLVGGSILRGRGRVIELGVDNGTAGSLVALVVLAVLVSWFAFGIGLIVRNSPAAVSTFLLWPLLGEGIIALVLAIVGSDGLTRWLPYQSAITAVDPAPDPDALGRPGAWVWFGVVSLAVVAVGLVANERRDA